MNRSIVCLHGLGRSPADWDAVRPMLSRYGEVVTPALPPDPVAALQTVRYAVPPGSIVIGHSFGAVLAVRLGAADHTLAGLVLTSSFFPPSRNGRTYRATLTDYLHHRVEFVRSARPVRAGAGGNGRALRQLVRTAARRTGFETDANAVAAPVLVVHARDDHYVPVAFAEAAASRHPAWSSAVLDTGGHFPHVDRPDTWTQVVSAWLDGL